APVSKDGAQDCLGLLRVAQIHVVRRQLHVFITHVAQEG
ncbi:hypothetical protein A2U01_0088546, partial [Trifolium medium]|nr:hypothetical protein [Trifolium medium]